MARGLILVIPALVVAEVPSLIGQRLGVDAEATFWESLQDRSLKHGLLYHAGRANSFPDRLRRGIAPRYRGETITGRALSGRSPDRCRRG